MSTTITVWCETCEQKSRRRETTRTPCPKCKGVDVWQINKEGQWVGRAGPLAATPMFEVNDLGHLRVYSLAGMATFSVSKNGYMISRDEARRLGEALIQFADSGVAQT